MPILSLPTGDIHYRVAGPQDSTAPPLVLVHGVLVDGRLWDELAERLAAAGVRSYAPDLPLGAHAIARPEDADQSPRGVARHLLAFLEALGLEDVTLVGNDTGGAICQYLLDTDPARIGRLVLTNCDAFEQFPPPFFRPVFTLLKSAAATRALIQPLRLRALRHSPAGYGLLSRRLDAPTTAAWIEPALGDASIRRDLARFCRAIDRDELRAVSRRLASFRGPALVVWGEADRAFTPSLAQRLVDVLDDAELVWVPGSRTFVMRDDPGALAAILLEHVGAPA